MQVLVSIFVFTLHSNTGRASGSCTRPLAVTLRSASCEGDPSKRKLLKVTKTNTMRRLAVQDREPRLRRQARDIGVRYLPEQTCAQQLSMRAECRDPPEEALYRWQPLPRSFAFGGSEADNTLMAGSSAACSPRYRQ